MFVRQVAAVRDVAALIPECHDVMWSGLRTFVLCILLGGSGMAAADVEPAADSASLKLRAGAANVAPGGDFFCQSQP